MRNLLALVPLALFAMTIPAHAGPKETAAAKVVVTDLLKNFWDGDARTGHIVNTYNGYRRTDDPRGILWERSTFLVPLENAYQVTKDPGLKARIAADWAHVTATIKSEEIQSVGVGSHNVGQDDAGWTSTMCLAVYRATGDRRALEDAKGLFNHAYDRWVDAELGGGMWYNDERTFKASYQVALVLVGIRIYELTRQKSYWDHAIAMYQWMEDRLLRPDGLYWCEMWRTGPQAVGGINQARSVVFLGGNMGMAVAHARLYRDTKDQRYRERAIRTAEAILKYESDGKGHYLDDRDAWANSFFMGEWAAEVLTLPGIRPAHAKTLLQTARAIRLRDRTPDGYYGGCWNGPLGDDCAWTRAGFKPEQVMVSATAGNVVIGAAAIGVRHPWPAPVAPPAP